MDIVIIFVALGLAVIVGLIANSKGYNGFVWFIYGSLLWPVALIHVLLKDKTPEAQGRVPCPYCQEMIKKEARVCPHCQRDLVS